MKSTIMVNKLVGILFLLVVLLVSMASAEVTIVNEETGVIRIERLATLAEKEAIANPGKKVPVLSRAPSRHQGFWWLTPVETYSQIVVFTDNKLVRLDETGEVVGQREFAIYKIILLITMGLMGASNFFFWRKREGDYSTAHVVVLIVAFVAFALILILIAVFPTIATALHAFSIVTAATVAFIATLVESRPTRILYIFCSAIFYILTTIIALFS